VGKPLRSDANDVTEGGLRLGRIVAVNAHRRVLVEVDGVSGPIVARLAISTDAARLRRAIRSREIAVLAFEGGDLGFPIVLGLVASPPRKPVEEPSALPEGVIQVDVDGRRVRLKAADEIVLECGKASVTLRRNGKIVIRGTHVETNSEGTNRIKGGQVRIN
jgi:hypothetical protein